MKKIKANREEMLLGALLFQLGELLRDAFNQPFWAGGSLVPATHYDRKELTANRCSITIRPHGWGREDHITFVFQTFGEEVCWYELIICSSRLTIPNNAFDHFRTTIRPNTQRMYDWYAIGEDASSKFINGLLENRKPQTLLSIAA